MGLIWRNPPSTLPMSLPLQQLQQARRLRWRCVYTMLHLPRIMQCHGGRVLDYLTEISVRIEHNIHIFGDRDYCQLRTDITKICDGLCWEALINWDFFFFFYIYIIIIMFCFILIFCRKVWMGKDIEMIDLRKSGVGLRVLSGGY